ncbi:MAG: tol-pal system-associated acyl-CoA thioesterase [Xanthomonadales bacterium]|nr:tol-pal system-associated acyl-CoA thioesterase [Xanthomonadales bacterium]NIX11814.1 tol-pal system-associated acyl-CoA thioesterase [Xanthomonadales bacterium]
MGDPFVWQLRVYWEDTDGGGVVYHSRYLNFFERARTEWLRSMGMVQSRLVAEENLVFVVRRMEIDFFRPARMDDELAVSVHSVRPGGSKMEFAQEMLRRSDGVLLASAEVTAACLAADTFRPVRLPGWIREKMQDNLAGADNNAE